MILLSTLLLFITTFVHPAPPSPTADAAQPDVQPAAHDPASLSHLPSTIQHDIQAWRERIKNAKCLKVVCETDETWANLHDLDPAGAPRIVHHEHFQTNSWMMPDSIWIVIFPFEAGAVNTSRPVFQEYWSAKDRKVWRRFWSDATSAYSVSREECTDPFGPPTPGFDIRGCIYAAVTESWLAGGPDLSKRSITVSSVAFLRHPNLAIIPPIERDFPGVWLDVFKEQDMTRNQDTGPSSLYRRNDLMLLARSDRGEPELRQWRTIVTTDPSESGKKPQLITGTRRFSYSFYEEPPSQLTSAIRSFVADVDRPPPK